MSDDKLDEFIRDSQNLIGKEDKIEPAGWGTVDITTIVRFCYGIYDTNPLWLDNAYVITTRYGCLLAPPTFFAAVRIPESKGSYHLKDYGLEPIITNIEWEWSNIIRIGDKTLR